MATTSIWSVKGWIGKVLSYAENPDKTMQQQEQELSDVIAYAVNEEKTKVPTDEIADEKEEIMEQYVSGINCSHLTARDEMVAVKKRFGKEDGIIAFHGYQSFAAGECTPQMAHEIGVKLAEELWGDRYQVLVATHLDKASHLHNHFVVNSVSFVDGIRYYRSNQDYRKMRSVSDRLCREYNLSVIPEKDNRKGKHYGEWRAEQEGKPTYRGLVRADVDDAISKARTEKQFFHYLKEKGYAIKIGKDITVKPQGRDRGIKLTRNFGEDYTLDAIRHRILTQHRSQTYTPKKEPSKVYVLRVHGSWEKKRKIGGLRGLYLHYCYRLGILPKNKQNKPKQISPIFHEELCKLETISKETRLLCRYHIDTKEQLFSLKEKLEAQLDEQTEKRKTVRYQQRHAKTNEEREGFQIHVSQLTEEISELREEVKLCEGIAVRSESMKEKLRMVQQEKQKEKEDKQHEHSR